jgi:hypothetical protein
MSIGESSVHNGVLLLLLLWFFNVLWLFDWLNVLILNIGILIIHILSILVVNVLLSLVNVLWLWCNILSNDWLWHWVVLVHWGV